MRCPVCGFEVKSPDASNCPNCGWALSRPADQSGSVSPSPIQPTLSPMPPAPVADQLGVAAAPPDIPTPSPAQASEAAPPAGAPGVPPPPYGWPAPPSMPYGPPGYAPPPGYGGYSTYGQPLPPGALYAAPPTYPLPVGAPPSMPYGAPYPGYSPGTPFPGYPGGMPPGPPPAPPKRRVGLIVGITAAVVLVLFVAAAGALYAFVPQVRALVTGASAAPTASVASAPTATATPSETILYQNTFASEAADWGNDAHCFLGTGGYHIKDGYTCYVPIGEQIDVDVTVDVKQISGPTNQPYGIAVRLNSTSFARYEFALDALGHWVVFRCDGKTCDRLVDYSAAASIRGGLNITNTLEVKVKGTHFDFFANGTKIGQMDDSTYASGLVGLSGTENGECVFSNLTVAEPK